MRTPSPIPSLSTVVKKQNKDKRQQKAFLSGKMTLKKEDVMYIINDRYDPRREIRSKLLDGDMVVFRRKHYPNGIDSL